MMMRRFGLSLALGALAAAPAAATQASTVIADAIEPPAPVLRITADRDSTPTGMAGLQFRLAPIPADIEPTSCALRLVMAEAVPPGDDNGVILQLVDAAADADRPRPVAAIRVPPGTPKDTGVVLRSRALCATLQPPLRREAGGDARDLARFRLLTSTRDGALAFFGATPERPSQVPRLMIAYERAERPTGTPDWGQIRNDAGHGGRSAWRLYDPEGRYDPTSAAAAPIPVSGVRTDLQQSPLLVGGRIVTVTDLGASRYRLAAVDRSGTLLDQVTRGELPRFLGVGGAGRLAYVTENRILLFDPLSLGTAPAEVPTPEGETMLEPPAIGRDGALYTVTQQNVRAFSPGLLESWRFRTGQDDVSAVSLSADEATAYVLFGGAAPTLVALDAGSGDCRWQQPLPKIARSPNEPMPVPVVAGADILVTQAFPTGDLIYVVHDTPPPSPGDRGELVMPAAPGTPCRAATAPRGMTEIGIAGDHIPAAMAGTGDDAWYLRAGALCRGRSDPDGSPGALWDERCRPLDGCAAADTGRITLLIGDSSGGASAAHLYGLAAATKQVFFISPNLAADGDLAPRCRMQAFADLGPNLVLGADGTLFNTTEQRGLQAIVPAGFPPTAEDIALSPEHLRSHDGSAFRAPGTISTAPDLNLGAGTDVILVAGGRIVFGPGLRIGAGASLRARVGF